MAASGDCGREGGGNGQERRRRDERVRVRAFAWREGGGIGGVDAFNACGDGGGEGGSARKKRRGEEGGAPSDLDPAVRRSGVRGGLDAVGFTSDGGEREAVGVRV